MPSDMSRRPQTFRQREVTRAIRAAKQAGATEVEVRVAGASILVRLAPSTGAETRLEPAEDIVL
jgi:hypothetical protein